MTTLTFYGGVNEIGGNKVLLEDRDTKIFLDFGMSFKLAGRFFSEFVQPRKANGLQDFIALGLIPKLKGIYRKDFSRHDGVEVSEEPEIDGVLISHAHLDHMAYITHLHESMKIHCSKITYLTMKAMDETGSGSFNDFVKTAKTFEFKRGGLSRVRGEYKDREIEAFDSNSEFKVGNLNVKGIALDHSLLGANGFIVETSDGNIAYTGDLRFHGLRPEDSMRFVEEAVNSDVNTLICEGTRINEEKMSESDVRERISKVISDSKGLVVANFPVRDTDRLRSFYEAAKENGRKLAINFKQAYLLRELRGENIPRIDDPDLLIYAKKKSWGLIAEDVDLELKRGDYDRWERVFLDAENLITFKDVRERQKEIVLYLDNYSVQELIDIKPDKDSCYIRSMCEPFDLEMELDWERVKNWLKHFNLTPIHQIHASGHADGSEIIEMIRMINPRMLFPIHTEHPEFFAKALSNTEIRVVHPSLSKAYTLA